MADSPRMRKIADRIQKTVAMVLERRIKDPRLGFVTITDVKVTGDLQNATIFYTVYGSDKDRNNTVAALNSAKGLIRSEVGKALGIRLTPQIEFVLDALPETVASIEDALLVAKVRDEAVSRLAENAQYAGEENPYKTPHSKHSDDDFEDFEIEDDQDEPDEMEQALNDYTDFSDTRLD